MGLGRVSCYPSLRRSVGLSGKADIGWRHWVVTGTGPAQDWFFAILTELRNELLALVSDGERAALVGLLTLVLPLATGPGQRDSWQSGSRTRQGPVLSRPAPGAS
jgi:hypothetical protein